MAASVLGPGVCGVLCVLFISHSPGSPKSKSHWPSQPDVWGLVFPVQGLWAGESVWGSGPLLLGKQLCSCKLFLHPGVWALTALHLIPLTVLLWFPCIFSCRRSFLLVFCFVSFSLIVFL